MLLPLRPLLGTQITPAVPSSSSTNLTLISSFSSFSPSTINPPKTLFFPPATKPSSRRRHFITPLLLSSSKPHSSTSSTPNPEIPNPKRRCGRPKKPPPGKPTSSNTTSIEDGFPTLLPRKTRRGRPSEAVRTEDFIRSTLEQTFSAIRQQKSGQFPTDNEVFRQVNSRTTREDDDDEEEEKGAERRRSLENSVVDSDDPNWPLDSDVGWGIRASEYFDKHPVKNVVDEDGNEVDWEGESEGPWIKEINCLEWESFAYHPSPLVVLVFERYNRVAENWKALKELEKAFQVYWSSKDKLPPRTVKIDINIERDLAYALKAEDCCPQLLFLRGNRILYREREVRCADDIVRMISFFYYNAKKPEWIDQAALASPYYN